MTTVVFILLLYRNSERLINKALCFNRLDNESDEINLKKWLTLYVISLEWPSTSTITNEQLNVYLIEE
ncbi:hypothetical protein, partial [Photobacterium aquimaris]|uniref:hypothetical protein n=1 Tax=Photobacterium aquimaris TaxID=512643 RepID=UPI00197B6391